jgi:hypothetical protein
LMSHSSLIAGSVMLSMSPSESLCRAQCTMLVLSVALMAMSAGWRCVCQRFTAQNPCQPKI